MPRSYPRPRFVREESWRYKRVKTSWRSPKGKSSRVRRSKNGWPPVVKIGYSHAKASRGLHPSGFREVFVWRPKDLEDIDPNSQVARIGHTVGENKRMQIIDEAKKAGIRILNPGLRKPTEPEVVPEPAPAEKPEESKEEPPTSAPHEEPKEEETEKMPKKTTKRKRSK
jgi:large subunit ribosomal protein L32e